MSQKIRASHILLMYAGAMRSQATRSKEEARSLIGEIKSQIDGGADFGELAQQHSDCPSGAEGGDLGLFGRGMMVESFEQAAFALGHGETSGVVETPFGFHLIRRTA